MVWLSPSPKGPFLESGPPSTSSWLHVCKKKKNPKKHSYKSLQTSLPESSIFTIRWSNKTVDDIFTAYHAEQGQTTAQI